VLISDNIAENQGGDLVEQCLARSIKQLFTCPYHPEQDFVEGYIGRITTMASFGMVYSEAPLFMWIWSVRTAVFTNYIMASYYSEQQVWATPYELIHGELFPDASIVVPFGCGVLVLLTEKERAKFKSRCALMLFVHYADDHPLYTYAVYSPRTRKVLMRQDCIFLNKLFPMRVARSAAGMDPNGESFQPIRSPRGNQCVDSALSFDNWSTEDPLPQYDDHVRGWKLTRPSDSEFQAGRGVHESTLGSNAMQGRHHPSHPAFGETSAVPVNSPQFPVSLPDRVTTPGEAPFRGPTSLTMGPRGTGFSIWITYFCLPNEPHLHRVYTSMLVTYLYTRVAALLSCEPSVFHLLVHEEHLWHSGSITDRISPDTLQPTCFLTPRAVVTVKMIYSETISINHPMIRWLVPGRYLPIYQSHNLVFFIGS
jgi:hypothetical protein